MKKKQYNRAEAMQLYGKEQDRIQEEMKQQNTLFNVFKGK